MFSESQEPHLLPPSVPVLACQDGTHLAPATVSSRLPLPTQTGSIWLLKFCVQRLFISFLTLNVKNSFQPLDQNRKLFAL